MNVRSHKQWQIFAVLTCVLALVGFADIGEDMNDPGWPALERRLADLLPPRSPAWTRVALAATFFGNNTTILILCLWVLACRWPAALRRDKLGFVGACLLSTVGNLILKTLFRRDRPGVIFEPLVHETFYSFPSGHTMISTCAYGFLTYLIVLRLHRSWSRVVFVTFMTVLILAIGLSRVYVAAHYPGDVMGGFAAGWVCLWLAIWLHHRLGPGAAAGEGARSAPG